MSSRLPPWAASAPGGFYPTDRVGASDAWRCVRPGAAAGSLWSLKTFSLSPDEIAEIEYRFDALKPYLVSDPPSHAAQGLPNHVGRAF